MDSADAERDSERVPQDAAPDPVPLHLESRRPLASSNSRKHADLESRQTWIASGLEECKQSCTRRRDAIFSGYFLVRS